MTARQFIDSPVLKVAAYAILLGIAWANLKADVQQKADKATVEAMAADIRDIKSILCQSAKADSFCRPD